LGRIGTGNEIRSRTLTHEVGHWLNLYHTWGPTNNAGLASNCGEDDDVLDTPNTIGVTSCKLSENTCGVKANVENYMDYSYCSKMFTAGQRDRMRASLLTLQRSNIWTPQNQVLTGIDGSVALCAADFRVDKEFYCVGEAVTIKDNSTQGATSWVWEMEGATPSTSIQKNPVVTYASSGSYKVKLTVSDGTTTLSKTKTAFVHVNSISELPYFEGFENYPVGASTVDNAIMRNLTPNHSTFEITKEAAATDSKSVCYHNFYANEDALNEFISPMFNLSTLANSDKVTLSFKYAYKKKLASDNEKLTVYASKDCGVTWQTRKDLTGTLLSNDVDSMNYIPEQTDFTTVHVTNISNTFFTTNFQFKLSFQSSNGNNLYLDDINLYKGAPSDVNIVGVSELTNLATWNAYPNPAVDELTIMYHVNQYELLPIVITDITGKIVFINNYKSPQGKNEVYLDISNLSKGIYMIQLGGQTKKFIKE
jgi:PKD repeat protein